MLQGHSFGASGGLGVFLDASIGASYAPLDISNPFGKSGGFISISGQVGLGIQGSPASVINIQGNYQYTPIVTQIFKF
ncbi:hypothetical protein [Flavobacterium sp. JP2137]|uniref:hypothetical protein n=1 Tax=Flavobacterium sp. JP2137 TaxID=3414510 RepID=UPI003D301293